MKNVILNQASVNYEYNQGSAIIDKQAQSNTVDTLINQPLIKIQKTVCNNYFKPGDYITYSISISNMGGAVANNVVISEPLVNQTYLANSALLTLNGVHSDALTVGNIVNEGTITGGFGFQIATLPANTTAIITFKAKPNSGVDTITNKATVYYGPKVEGQTRSNVESNETTSELKYAELRVTKSAPSTVDCGSNFTYTINVENTGNTAAQNASLKDKLPMEFVVPATGAVTVDGEEVLYTIDAETNMITIYLGTLNPGSAGNRTIIINGKIVCS